MFQSHLLGQPIVIVGDLVNWQKALNAEFKSVAMNFPESFKRAAGATGTTDKHAHAFQVSFSRPKCIDLCSNCIKPSMIKSIFLFSLSVWQIVRKWIIVGQMVTEVWTC